MRRYEIANSIEAKCAAELSYILTSMDKGSREDPEVRERLVTSLVLSLQRNEFEANGTISINEAILKHAPQYILAGILKDQDIDTYARFQDAVRRLIPIYKKNPRGTFLLGNLPWRAKYFHVTPVNEAQSKRSRKASATRREKLLEGAASTTIADQGIKLSTAQKTLNKMSGGDYVLGQPGTGATPQGIAQPVIDYFNGFVSGVKESLGKLRDERADLRAEITALQARLALIQNRRINARRLLEAICSKGTGVDFEMLRAYFGTAPDTSSAQG